MRNRFVVNCKIAQKECGIDEAHYRKILWEAAGVKSSKEITDESQMFAILAAMNGKKPQTKPKPRYIDPYAKPKPIWKKITGSAEEWANIGETIEKYDKMGISIVAVLPAIGDRYLKCRRR